MKKYHGALSAAMIDKAMRLPEEGEHATASLCQMRITEFDGFTMVSGGEVLFGPSEKVGGTHNG